MNMKGSNLTIEDPNKTAYNCADCNRPDHDESQMVFCDQCQNWYHFGCQKVTDAVKNDDLWMCSDCKVADDDKQSAESVDEELVEAAKALALEKELHKRELIRKMELAKMRLKLDNEKKEMEWEFEKQQIQMKIASEEAFNKKRQMEREQLQHKLSMVLADRDRSPDTKGNRKIKKHVAILKPPVADDKHSRKPTSSTPYDVGEASNKSVSLATTEPTQTPRRRPNMPKLTKAKDVNKDAQREKTIVLDTHSDECDDVDTDDQSDVEYLPDKEEPDEITPTRAQLTARQFLSQKLPKFSGRFDQWPLFNSNFESSSKACGFSNLENLVRLQECLVGPAREAVANRLLLPAAVPQVIETLRMLYGRPEQLLSTLLMKVRNADPPKVDKLESFIRFGMTVQQLCDHLEATKLLDHLINPMLIQEVVEKLPASTKLDWVRFKRQQNQITLRTLSDFLLDLV